MKGRRKEQDDALMAIEQDGMVAAYFADGVYASENGGEMASFAVDYAEASRHGVASLSRLSANIPLAARRRFVAGTDGLEIQRLSYFYEEELARAKNPQEFMQDLMTELLAYGRDNTAGLAFFCER